MENGDILNCFKGNGIIGTSDQEGVLVNGLTV